MDNEPTTTSPATEPASDETAATAPTEPAPAPAPATSLGASILDLVSRLNKPKSCAGACGALVRGRYCDACFDAKHAIDWAKAVERAVTIATSDLPAKFRGLDLETASEEKLIERIPHAADTAIARARECIGDRKGAVLVGQSAAGKTTLAAAMLASHVHAMLYPRNVDEDPGEGPRWARAESCRYVRALRLAREHVNHGAGRGVAPFIEEAMTAPAIVLDDLGIEPLGATVIETLFERGDNGLVTFVTTSLDEDKLIARYGEGAIRRMLQDVPVIQLGGR